MLKIIILNILKNNYCYTLNTPESEISCEKNTLHGKDVQITLHNCEKSQYFYFSQILFRILLKQDM